MFQCSVSIRKISIVTWLIFHILYNVIAFIMIILYVQDQFPSIFSPNISTYQYYSICIHLLTFIFFISTFLLMNSVLKSQHYPDLPYYIYILHFHIFAYESYTLYTFLHLYFTFPHFCAALWPLHYPERQYQPSNSRLTCSRPHHIN